MRVMRLTEPWQWFATYTGITYLTALCLPLALLAAWALARVRLARGAAPAAARRTAWAEVGMVYGTVPWVWMTMLPGSRAGEVTGAVSLVPLRDLGTMDDFQVIGNLVILAALGFFAPLRYAATASFPRALALGLGVSTTIEVLQYVLVLDRVSSVDDVLLNASGCVIGAALSRPWWTARGTGRTRERADSHHVLDRTAS
jgi:hypothetical protein